MPLASQLSSFFSAGSTSPTAAATPSSSSGALDDVVLAPEPTPRHAGQYSLGLSERSARGSDPGHIMKSEDVEVEGRPPYLHVRLTSP